MTDLPIDATHSYSGNAAFFDDLRCFVDSFSEADYF